MVWDLPPLEIEKTDIPETDGSLAVNTAASPGGDPPSLWSLENWPHNVDFTDHSHERSICPELLICTVYTWRKQFVYNIHNEGDIVTQASCK